MKIRIKDIQELNEELHNLNSQIAEECDRLVYYEESKKYAKEKILDLLETKRSIQDKISVMYVKDTWDDVNKNHKTIKGIQWKRLRY